MLYKPLPTWVNLPLMQKSLCFCKNNIYFAKSTVWCILFKLLSWCWAIRTQVTLFFSFSHSVSMNTFLNYATVLSNLSNNKDVGSFAPLEILICIPYSRSRHEPSGARNMVSQREIFVYKPSKKFLDNGSIAIACYKYFICWRLSYQC